MLDVPLDRVTLRGRRRGPDRIPSSPATSAPGGEDVAGTPAAQLLSAAHADGRHSAGKVKDAIPASIRTALKRIVPSQWREVESRPFEPWTWSEPWKRR